MWNYIILLLATIIHYIHQSISSDSCRCAFAGTITDCCLKQKRFAVSFFFGMAHPVSSERRIGATKGKRVN
ncbi:hypothetical protein GQ55_2G483000 [Panicum hallii var. hallii]|uniref:Secreted protein n=1 Tax=Panicum hallii var. hallii TaxID=1504633 RepID=A0A2T7F0E9_9POAL|nr:hypothetical protein GQ55_2G483000 [Panicum hallii var. hallii]